MTCEYDGCTRDDVGTVEWDGGTERDYCQKHLRDTRVEFPEFVTEVRLA